MSHDAETESLPRSATIEEPCDHMAIYVMLIVIVAFEIIEAGLLGLVAYWMYTFIHI